MIPLHDDNPTRTRPIVNFGLMALCVLVYLWQLSLGPAGEAAILTFGFRPGTLLDRTAGLPQAVPPGLTIFTSMFLHGGFAHLAGNMLYLWIFGDNVEDQLGHFRYIGFYLLSGMAAALAQGFADPGSAVPMVGASGAISGVLGAYILMFPQARVLSAVTLGIFIRLIRVPAWVLLGLWFALQFVSAALGGPQSGGGVAFWAHVGGFVAGCGLLPILRRRDRRPPPARPSGPWGPRF